MNEFIAYYRALSIGSVRYTKRGGWTLEIFLIVISGLLVAGVTGCLNNSVIDDDTANYSGTMFVYAATFIYVMALSMGTNRRLKPSALNLMPINYKKRAVFSHLAVMLYGLVFMALWLVFMLAIILFISLVALIFTGDWVFLPTFEQNAGIAVYPDVQGVLFVILLFIALYGAGMAVSYIRNKKIRYSMLFAVPAIFGAFALLTVNMSSDIGKFVVCNHMLFNFKNLPLSWLWLAVFALIALGICTVSVCLAIKNEKPKAY